MDEFFQFVPPELLSQSGKVVYSGRKAFSETRPLYLLGLNPGGDPNVQRDETIAWDMEQSLNFAKRRNGPLTLMKVGRVGIQELWGLQPRVRHLCQELGLDPRRVPSSNLIFVRSQRESGLGLSSRQLKMSCWPFHRAVIERLDVKLIACFGKTAGNFVRHMLGADRQIASFVEQNGRRWTSTVHASSKGPYVATLAHPSVAAWNVPATDPSSLLRPFLS